MCWMSLLFIISSVGVMSSKDEKKKLLEAIAELRTQNMELMIDLALQNNKMATLEKSHARKLLETEEHIRTLQLSLDAETAAKEQAEQQARDNAEKIKTLHLREMELSKQASIFQRCFDSKQTAHPEFAKQIQQLPNTETISQQQADQHAAEAGDLAHDDGFHKQKKHRKFFSPEEEAKFKQSVERFVQNRLVVADDNLHVEANFISTTKLEEAFKSENPSIKSNHNLFCTELKKQVEKADIDGAVRKGHRKGINGYKGLSMKFFNKEKVLEPATQE